MRAKVLTALLIACMTLSACTAPIGTATLPPAPSSAPTESWPDRVEVHIYASDFRPLSVTVKAGARVTWTNKSDTMHIVAGDDGTWISEPLEKDGTYERTFDQPGTYTYHCDVHWFMKGEVVVVP